jgi:hypothetical protein
LWSLLEHFPNVFAWHKRKFDVASMVNMYWIPKGFLLIEPPPIDFHYGKRLK